jgi:F420-dependent oxidoreductase-like protein
MIRVGLHIPSFTFPNGSSATLFDTVSSITAAAESSGWDSVWLMDHFYQLPDLGSSNQPMLEAYTMLSALAATTSRVNLGAMVTGVTYRNPALLAKMVTTLDVISNGRAILGIGAGWFEREHVDYGFEFGTFTDRFEKLEEALQIAKSMFVNDTTTFEGKWFSTHKALNNPKPVRTGGPPILIGGSGERKTLRMVAQYGDYANVGGDTAECRRLMNVLDEHCERLGRNPAEIGRTKLCVIVAGATLEAAQRKRDSILGGLGLNYPTLDTATKAMIDARFMVGGPDDIAEHIAAHRVAGIDGFVFTVLDAHHIEPVIETGELLRAAFT